MASRSASSPAMANVSSTLAQIMSYMAALAAERGRTVRGYLIAEGFSERVKWAARRDPDLRLLRYVLNPTFEAVE